MKWAQERMKGIIWTPVVQKPLYIKKKNEPTGRVHMVKMNLKIFNVIKNNS